MAIATLTTGKGGDNARILQMPDGTGKTQAAAITYPRGQYPAIATIAGIAAANVAGSGPWDLASLSGLPTIDPLDAANLWIGGDCSLSGGTIQVVLAYLDTAGRIMQISANQSLAAQGNFKSGTQYLAQGPPLSFDLVGSGTVKILVPAAPTGTWNLYPVLYI